MLSLALLLLAAPVAAPADPVAPPPTTTRYKITQRLFQVIDVSGMGGGTQEVLIKFTSYVAVSLADSASGQSFRAVIDSIVGDTLPPGMPSEAFAGAKGATWTGFIDADGKMQDLKASKQVEGPGSMQGVFNDFLPPVKKGVAAGAAWSDTVAMTNPLPGGTMNINSVRTFKAVGAVARGKRKPMQVDATIASVLNGSQENPQAGAMEIEGKGTTTASYYVMPDGHFVGSTAEGKQELTLSAVNFPAPIPVSITTNVTIDTIE